MVAHYLPLREPGCFIAAPILQISRTFSLRMQMKDFSSRAEVTYEWCRSPNSPSGSLLMFCTGTKILTLEAAQFSSIGYRLKT
jgi:hypothetical protein